MSEKANRLLRIYSRLRKAPVTINTIKDWAKKNSIEISERTLYRDLEEIQKSILLEGEKIIEFIGEKNKKTWKIEFANSTDEVTEFDINSFYLFKNFAPLALINARSNSLEQFENKLYKAYNRSKFEKNETVSNTQIKTTHFYEFPY